MDSTVYLTRDNIIDAHIDARGIEAPAEARYVPVWEPDEQFGELDLAEAGITKFDVASSVEIARMAAVPNAELYFMNPVKSRVSIRTAFDEFGVRTFAFDSEDELDKTIGVAAMTLRLGVCARPPTS